MNILRRCGGKSPHLIILSQQLLIRISWRQVLHQMLGRRARPTGVQHQLVRHSLFAQQSQLVTDDCFRAVPEESSRLPRKRLAYLSQWRI